MRMMHTHLRHWARGDLSHVGTTIGWRVWMIMGWWWWHMCSPRQGILQTYFSRDTHDLEALPTSSITLVLPLFSIESIVQELLLYFCTLLFWFGKNPINLFLLLQCSFPFFLFRRFSNCKKIACSSSVRSSSDFFSISITRRRNLFARALDCAFFRALLSNTS